MQSEATADQLEPQAGAARSALRVVVPIFLFVRVVLVLWMWAVRQAVSEPIAPDSTLRPYLGVEAETNPWLEPWQRWDTLHYQAIAERGYEAFDGALFSPPLYPGLMRIADALVGSNSLLAGLIISSLAYFGGLLAFYQLALRELRTEAGARRATLYLAVFPTAFFFLAAYTESLLLLGSTVSVLAAQRRRWLGSGLAAAVAALSRLVGVALVIPLGYLALRSWRTSRTWRAWIPALGSLLGASVLPLYSWLALGLSPLAPIQAQTGRFRGGFSFPGANLVRAVGRVLSGEAFMADAIDLTFLLLFLVCGVLVWRRYSTTISLIYLGFLLPVLVRTAGAQPLLGTARYVLGLFPAFFVLSEWGALPWRHRLILYGSTAGLLFLSGQFAIWGWVG